MKTFILPNFKRIEPTSSVSNTSVTITMNIMNQTLVESTHSHNEFERNINKSNDIINYLGTKCLINQGASSYHFMSEILEIFVLIFKY
jgi:hypothetical protein